MVGKYNVNINMNNRQSSHTLILEQVKPHSSVLEMGCATGYMTKYLYENLGCNVHVVEIDKDSIKQAKPYAYDWYCGDLNEDGWKKYYGTYPQYDYILFADVIEHLTDSLKTLKMSVELLRPNGKMIISIPNICHNDVLIQMFYDHFNYTPLGLLDSTHIHFWGGDDFARFVDEIGLKVTKTEKVMFPTQGTEQRSPFRVNEDLLRLLRTRPNGEVYQWVFTCEKK